MKNRNNRFRSHFNLRGRLLLVGTALGLTLIEITINQLHVGSTGDQRH